METESESFDDLTRRLATLPPLEGLTSASLLDLPEPLARLAKSLLRAGPAAAAQLAEQLHLSPVHARMLAEQLVQKGFLVRDEYPARGEPCYRLRLASTRRRAVPVAFWKAFGDVQPQAPLPPLITQMLRPAFYPHSVREPIHLVQTHISYVLLTGPYAYKVKKPVDFGFLDFSTLEKRAHFCREELRLNSRLSPDLYVDLLPIGLAGSTYRLGDSAALAAEYTLRMRQFSEDALLGNLLQAGALRPERLVELGAIVANFHQQAAPVVPAHILDFAASIQEVARGNYEGTDRYIGVAQTAEQLEQTRAFTDAWFARHADLLRQRQREGRVRECHGDLHLENICLHEGRIQVFDCIEFNEPFRWTDVLYDVAFTVMDLDFHGRRDLAAAFLAAYLGRTGDTDSLVCLPLYLSLRAYIKGKVTSFLLDDPSVPEVAKAGARERAAAYYRLAWSYAVDDQQPWLDEVLAQAGQAPVRIA